MRSSRAAAGSVLFLVVAPGKLRVLRAFGGILLAAGIVVLLDAFARFVREGRGTPAPVAPTERLVVGGLYRHVRNPMYLAVDAAILGQALLLGRIVLVAYAAVLGAAFWLFVRLYEEPTLARRYGAEYDAYRRAVPAWWPRRRPCPSGDVRDWTGQ